MARGISEAEYENLKRSASPAVRFPDSPRARAPSTRFRAGKPREVYPTVRRYPYPKKSGGMKDFVPVAIGIGAVVLIGSYLYNRNKQVSGLGACGQVQQIGGQIGNVLGSILGVPGLGSVVSEITGLFGPSAHYTPSGMLYDTAATDLKNNAVELADLTNELYSRIGRQNVPVPQWTMTSADDPKTGPYLATLLNDPAFNSATSPDALISLQADGVYDNAIQVQESMISAIENALTGLENGSLVVSAGTVVSANSPVATCANSTVVQAAQNASATGFCSAGASSFLSANSGYILAGAGVLGLILLLKKRS